MRFIVYGAGAVGGVLGGRMAEAGHEVLFIARGENARAIAKDGLVVESPDRSVTIDAQVVEAPNSIEFTEEDVVLLSMKSQDTDAALHALSLCAAATTPVFCVQNGVDNERAALRLFSSVYGVCVMCPAEHLVPGRVRAYSSPLTGMLDLGRYPSGLDEVASEVANAIASSTFESICRPDIMRWKYTKLLMNLLNAVEAVCGPEARSGRLAEMTRLEGVAVLGAAGIDFASEEEDRERRRGRMKLGPVRDSQWRGGSSWQSLQRSTGSIEADFLNGEIVLLGRMNAVPTPVNETLQRLAVLLAEKRAVPGSMSEEDVIAEVEAGG